MPQRRAVGRETVKTTLLMPTALWKRAKVRAMDEGRVLRDVLLTALKHYLAEKEKGGPR